MEYTERGKLSIKTEFTSRKIAMIILFVLFGENPDHVMLGMPATVWGPAFVVLFTGGIAFSVFNWRCPACNKYLGKSMNPKFCSKCGAPLT
jgi:hypothetical protein